MWSAAPRCAVRGVFVEGGGLSCSPSSPPLSLEVVCAHALLARCGGGLHACPHMFLSSHPHPYPTPTSTRVRAVRLQAKLKLPLLSYQKDAAHLLTVNFDPALVKLLREVKYFLLLGLEVPGSALEIFQKAETFRRQTGNLDLLVNMWVWGCLRYQAACLCVWAGGLGEAAWSDSGRGGLCALGPGVVVVCL